MEVQAPVVLEAAYESALIGHTVSHNATPRFVYSLVLLARREQARANISAEHARLSVWKMVQDITDMVALVACPSPIHIP